MGLDGFMGGQYQSNLTTLGIYKRQWLGSFGYMDFNIVGKAQWSNDSSVPYPAMPFRVCHPLPGADVIIQLKSIEYTTVNSDGDRW